MFSKLHRLFSKTPPEQVYATYIALVSRARHPFFYETLEVPDTLDGRFSLIVLHLFLLQQRLREEDPEFCRFLSEVFFADMDSSLREIGVSDTGVRYRIKAMAKAYHGALQAYTLSGDDSEALRGALARNLYGTVKEGSVALLALSADYVRDMQQQLANLPCATLTSGQWTWPAITAQPAALPA